MLCYVAVSAGSCGSAWENALLYCCVSGQLWERVGSLVGDVVLRKWRCCWVRQRIFVHASHLQEMPRNVYFCSYLAKAVAAGNVTEARVRLMVGRIFTAMYALNMITDPSPYTPTANVTTAAHASTCMRRCACGRNLRSERGSLAFRCEHCM